MSLSEETCKACRKGDPALTEAEVQGLITEVPGWHLAPGETELRRLFTFKDYLQGLDFISAVAHMAQAQDHHPDIEFGYKKALVRWTTHAVHGLSLNDFICAAKCNALAH